jgi:hypothetical protein
MLTSADVCSICRSLGDRISGPMSSAHRLLGSTMQTPGGRAVVTHYETLMLQFKEFEEHETQVVLTYADVC